MARRRRKLQPEEALSLREIMDAWPLLVPADRLDSFRSLERTIGEELFLGLSTRNQADLVLSLIHI